MPTKSLKTPAYRHYKPKNLAVDTDLLPLYLYLTDASELCSSKLTLGSVGPIAENSHLRGRARKRVSSPRWIGSETTPPRSNSFFPDA